MDTILGILRIILAAGGGILVTKGYLDDGALQQIIGAILALVAAVWSVISKKQEAAKVATAAATGVNPNTPTAPAVTDTPKQ